MLRAAAVLASTMLAALACGGGQSTSTQASPAAHCAAVAGLTGNVDDKGTAPLASLGTVVVGDEYFAPTCIAGASGTVTLTLHNSGRLLHNFSS